jgi:hypothetical protein
VRPAGQLLLYKTWQRLPKEARLHNWQARRPVARHDGVPQ